MPLTDAEKLRCRYHLGYPLQTTAASIQFGMPALTQTSFLVDNAVGKLLEPTCNDVRNILRVMDGIESKLVEAQDRLAATQLEELYLNNSEPDMLEKEYRRWGNRLADTLGAPIYPYSARYRGGLSGVTNIAVSG